METPKTMTLKAVILVGGAQKGTRFRPLSLQVPKPLFPVAGLPLIEHHIQQLCELKDLIEVFILGFYPPSAFHEFIRSAKAKYGIQINYLEEPESMGTAGGVLRFRDEILRPVRPSTTAPEGVFVLNSDICGDLPVEEMVAALTAAPKADVILLTTEATREQSINYGSVVVDDEGIVQHYVDKPTTFVSTQISCGLYLMRPRVWADQLEPAAAQPTADGAQLWFETAVFPQMVATGALRAVHTNRWWSQTKTPGAALYANRHYLRLYRTNCPERLASSGPQILGDVWIDPTAQVDPSAKIGPNVSVGANARIGAGVRIRETIILPECEIGDHCCVLYSVIGWRSKLGPWSRVEGTPVSPNPNLPFAKLDNKPLFNRDGRLSPSVTILGSNVTVLGELVILNTVCLPYKELTVNHANQIVL